MRQFVRLGQLGTLVIAHHLYTHLFVFRFQGDALLDKVGNFSCTPETEILFMACVTAPG